MHLTHLADENKVVLTSGGLVVRLVSFAVASDFTPVIFKLLGTLRMLIAGQGELNWPVLLTTQPGRKTYKCIFFVLAAAASQLGSNEEFVAKLVEWCRNDEHVGVKGEVFINLASDLNTYELLALINCVVCRRGEPSGGSHHSCVWRLERDDVTAACRVRVAHGGDAQV